MSEKYWIIGVYVDSFYNQVGGCIVVLVLMSDKTKKVQGIWILRGKSQDLFVGKFSLIDVTSPMMRECLFQYNRDVVFCLHEQMQTRLNFLAFQLIVPKVSINIKIMT